MKVRLSNIFKYSNVLLEEFTKKNAELTTLACCKHLDGKAQQRHSTRASTRDHGQWLRFPLTVGFIYLSLMPFRFLTLQLILPLFKLRKALYTLEDKAITFLETGDYRDGHNMLIGDVLVMFALNIALNTMHTVLDIIKFVARTAILAVNLPMHLCALSFLSLPLLTRADKSTTIGWLASAYLQELKTVKDALLDVGVKLISFLGIAFTSLVMLIISFLESSQSRDIANPYPENMSINNIAITPLRKIHINLIFTDTNEDNESESQDAYDSIKQYLHCYNPTPCLWEFMSTQTDTSALHETIYILGTWSNQYALQIYKDKIKKIIQGVTLLNSEQEPVCCYKTIKEQLSAKAPNADRSAFVKEFIARIGENIKADIITTASALNKLNNIQAQGIQSYMNDPAVLSQRDLSSIIIRKAMQYLQFLNQRQTDGFIRIIIIMQGTENTQTKSQYIQSCTEMGVRHEASRLTDMPTQENTLATINHKIEQLYNRARTNDPHDYDTENTNDSDDDCMQNIPDTNRPDANGQSDPFLLGLHLGSPEDQRNAWLSHLQTQIRQIAQKTYAAYPHMSFYYRNHRDRKIITESIANTLKDNDIRNIHDETTFLTPPTANIVQNMKLIMESVLDAQNTLGYPGAEPDSKLRKRLNSLNLIDTLQTKTSNMTADNKNIKPNNDTVKPQNTSDRQSDTISIGTLSKMRAPTENTQNVLGN